MEASAEVCEWWRLGIKGGEAAERTPAGSAAALVGSFSPSRRHTPKVRPQLGPAAPEATHPDWDIRLGRNSNGAGVIGGKSPGTELFGPDSTWAIPLEERGGSRRGL